MHRKPKTPAVTARRAIAVGALALPLTVAGAGLAHAGDHHKGDRGCDDHLAVQDGGLADLGIDVGPQLNLGGILSDGPVVQQNSRVDASNDGIQQFGCGDFDAFQADDLVAATLGADPQLNIGGILSGGPVQQGNVDLDRSNSGIIQG
ncbi:MAG TPA: hypothetical protein VKZ81_28005 [Pseudonocardia sp.]|uniref:hypothetical protein n=1 Tax=Pseudonocardia sp. TaxID=60912 RepID=UPI002B4B0B87|nr:hypothetical protein [Pseudonocardia sp.]HLU59324.1 hypothetical protein [Pseudonocardia sp.]